MKVYSETELHNKTKLGLRDVCREVGAEFSNDKSNPQLIEAILAVQQKKQQPQQFPDGQTVGKGKKKSPDEPGHVRVTSGATSQIFQIAGQTIKAAMGDLRGLLNIDPAAKPFVNGVEVETSYTLQDGDQLELVKKSGDKA